MKITVKIDADSRQYAASTAMHVLEKALVTTYGGDEGGWHVFMTVDEERRSISIEAGEPV